MGHGVKKLYRELGELARFVENAMRTISQAGRPIITSTSDLPAATSHLADLNKMTEEGTLEVMRLTELMQDNHARMGKECAAIEEVLKAMDCVTLAKRVERLAADLSQDDRCLTEIMTALSFQDLVAQRVKKLVAILDDVQDKLMKLVVVFGTQSEGSEDGKGEPGKSGDLLKQLEESKTTAMKQNVADEILAQYGFK
ncbi:MAG: protein phosphatase CheZ [Nitrospira sp.]|nr:protein phosphatase CheZ [Nitrospira sp.]